MPAVKRRAASPPIDSRRSPSSPKRARTEDEPRQQGTRNKGKGRQEDGEIDIEQGLEEDTPEQEAPDEDEERKFEEENEEIIRETIMNKGKSQGVSGHSMRSIYASELQCNRQGVAEMGIIESLEMHNFMCHKYLTFTFGPQINFIIGEFSLSEL